MFAWLGIVVGFAGCLFEFVRLGQQSAPPEDRSERPPLHVMGLNLLITLVFWGVSMIKRPPFSEGQSLGLGFLIGGISGTIAMFLSGRLGRSDRRRSASLAMSFFALFAISLTYQIFAPDLQWAMPGFAIGAAMSGILGRYTLPSESRSGMLTEEWALLCMVISGGVMLSIFHFGQTFQRGLWVLPILLASSSLLAAFIGTEIAGENRSSWITIAIASPIFLILSAVFAWKIAADWSLLESAVVGLAMMLVGYLISNRRSVEIAAIVVLAAVSFAVIAFKLWSGLGIAIGLIAACPVVCIASPEEWRGRAVRDLFAFGLSIFLFRLFMEAGDANLHHIDLRIHYAFIGAVLGAMMPVAMVSSLAKDRRLFRVLALAFLAAAASILMYMIWEVKAVMGLEFGLIVSAAMLLFLRLSGEIDGYTVRYPASLLILGSQLVAVRYINSIDFPMDQTRWIRITVLSAAALIFMLTLIFSRDSSAEEVENAR